MKVRVWGKWEVSGFVDVEAESIETGIAKVQRNETGEYHFDAFEAAPITESFEIETCLCDYIPE